MPRLLVLVMAALLFVVGCGSTKGEPTTITLDITTEALPEPRRIEVELGSEVTVQGASEITDVLHVHGYEREISLTAGEDFTDVFTADMAGVYEVETHDTLAVWATLVVR